MGIPSYFRIIVSKYNNILQNTNKYTKINRLFLDLNCAIHPCCREIVEQAKQENISPKENDMIANVLLKITQLVSLTRPNTLYIAVDGVAPLAKINQQRQRRYKAALEKNIWNTSKISPGTEFMDKLNIALDNFKSTGVNIIISNSNESGEGEHKIMKYINDTNKSPLPDVIYGLDADLIMLGLIARKSNILLLREKTEYNIEEQQLDTEGDYLYLNINNTKKGILQEFNKDNIYENQTLIDDYVFINFLLGNDFLKTIPSLQIRYNGMDLLLDSYHKCCSNNPYFQLVNNGEIIFDNFKIFLENIVDQENDTINEIIRIRDKQRKSAYYRTKGDTQKIEENQPLLNNPTEELIKFGESGWRTRYLINGLYNTTNFSLNTVEMEEYTEDIKDLCNQYFMGLSWCTRYYFKGYKGVSNIWYYKYSFAPDLRTFLNNVNVGQINRNDIMFYPALKPVEALLAMLPKQSKDLVSEKYQKLMDEDSPISYYYPDKFKEYSVLKRYSWENVPLLPKINLKLFRKYI